MKKRSHRKRGCKTLAAKSGGPSREVILRAGEKLQSAFDEAIAGGISLELLAELLGDEIRRRLPGAFAEGYASEPEGLLTLLQAEGGCARLTKAVFSRENPLSITASVLRQSIVESPFITYPTLDGLLLIPLWQVGANGRPLRGLMAVMNILRAGQNFETITPFAFFLQANPLTEGTTPLDLLRHGKVELVKRAARAHAE